MKKAIDYAREYAKEYWRFESEHINMEESILYAMDNFLAGIKISQEWFPIKRDNGGFTTEKQREEMLSNIPFLIKGETEREELCHEIDNDVDKEYYTHWRPLNRK